MTYVQHHASLHEKTVQEVARGSVHLPPRRRSGGRTVRVTASYSLKAHDLVMEAARKNLGPGQRIVIVSESEVHIVNR
jgi:hypothetical protein